MSKPLSIQYTYKTKDTTLKHFYINGPLSIKCNKTHIIVEFVEHNGNLYLTKTNTVNGFKSNIFLEKIEKPEKPKPKPETDKTKTESEDELVNRGRSRRNGKRYNKQTKKDKYYPHPEKLEQTETEQTEKLKEQEQE